MTSLSVLVPVYNEQYLVATSLSRLFVLEESPHLERIEVIVVDDRSTDGTPGVLQRFREEKAGRPGSRISWTFLRHERNPGDLDRQPVEAGGEIGHAEQLRLE